MRACIGRHGGSSTAPEWEKYERLVREHQSGIRDKLVEIMVSRSSAHVKAMNAINFDSASSSDGTSPYMETLTKETLTLHRVLGRYLSSAEVGVIMGRIREGYREQWMKAFREVKVGTKAGKERLQRDAGGLEKLGKVEGFEALGKEVLDVVEGRSVSEPLVSTSEAKGKSEPEKKDGDVEVMFEADEENGKDEGEK